MDGGAQLLYSGNNRCVLARVKLLLTSVGLPQQLLWMLAAMFAEGIIFPDIINSSSSEVITPGRLSHQK
jgi:hypothetical protein